MVIEIKIRAMGELVSDKLTMRETTLLENSVAIRRLEEIKLKLLKMRYKTDLEVDEEEKE